MLNTLPNCPPPPETPHPLVGLFEDPSPPAPPLALDSNRETVPPGGLLLQSLALRRRRAGRTALYIGIGFSMAAAAGVYALVYLLVI